VLPFASRDLEFGRHAAGLGRWRYGDTLPWCGCGGICLKSPGTLEAYCRRRDVEVFASRDRELGRCAVGVKTWRYGGSEVVSVRVRVCLKSPGGLEMRRKRVDVDV